MSNVHYRELKLHPGWEKRAEDHAANGKSFAVRPFNKQLHWAFLEDLCQRYGFVSSFDARQRTAYFTPRGD